jgi:hypothetical protein
MTWMPGEFTFGVNVPPVPDPTTWSTPASITSQELVDLTAPMTNEAILAKRKKTAY